MTVEIDPIAAIEASPVPFDLYREVHKGLRLALFRLIEAAGSADYTDETERDALVAHVQRVVALLNAHHGHEDSFDALVQRHAPTLAPVIEGGHIESETALVEIELRADKLACSLGVDAVVQGLDLYRFLALFSATYLAHMSLEEGAVMTALRDAMSTAELSTVEMAVRTSIAPPLMCAFVAVMAPAMNIDERTNLLGGMKAGAPAEIFELYRAAAEAALDPADNRAVAGRVGLA